MNMQQGLDSLLQEVETILGTANLAPQRQQYFEGAKYYLETLKRMTEEADKVRKQPPSKRTPPAKGTQETP